MFKKVLLFSAAMIAVAGKGMAQMQPCSTEAHYQALLAKYPQLAGMREQLNAQLNTMAMRTTAASDTTILDIPIVVHVVHDFGTENIADNDIYEAVKYWSVVFQKQNADTALVIDPFKPWIGNPRIRLHLATKDPNGNPTKGVVRHFSYMTIAGGDDAKYESWPNNKYINVWFVKTFDASHSGAAAYAYYPSSGAFMPYYDGVICLAQYINIQKTVPHELGHVLNLAHVWGNTNSPGVACGDDNVDDTPPTKGHTSCSSVDLADVTCATGYTRTYVSASGLSDSVVNYPDTTNTQNIMDYSYCELMFTKGQGVRMRNTLNNSTAGRNNLPTAANLAATGALAPFPDLPPVADFIMNKASSTSLITDARTYFLTVNNDASFVFRNTSWNDTISSVAWTFSNGASTPSSTSATTVNNKFSVPGWVNVSLTATSNAGSTTLNVPQAVYAADTAPVNTFGYVQDFATPADAEKWPMFNYYRNQFKWQYFAGAGYDDNACVRFRSYDTSQRVYGPATGDFDDLYTPAFKLDGVSGDVYFNFFTAGAATNNGLTGSDTKVADSLEVWASNSGGARWTKIGGFKGADLANTGTKASEYNAPVASEWKPRAIRIPESLRSYNTFFRFRYRPGNTGNNMYLDKVYVHPFKAGVKEALAAGAQFAVFPNPTNSDVTVSFPTGTTGDVAIMVKDLSGKTVMQSAQAYTAGTIQQFTIARSAMPAAGMYFVTVTVDGIAATQKLVVY